MKLVVIADSHNYALRPRHSHPSYRSRELFLSLLRISHPSRIAFHTHLRRNTKTPLWRTVGVDY